MKAPAEPDVPLLKLIGGDQLDVLTRASVVGTFDRRVWAALGGADDQFDKLAIHPMIEEVGGTSGRYRVHSEFQKMLFPRLEPDERQHVAAVAAASDDPHERALQSMVVDPDHAGDTLRAAMADALDRWDTAAMASWLRTADAALARIDLARQVELARVRRELATAAATRGLFWRSVVPQYYERALTRDLWDQLRAGPKWAVQLVAPGGTGKSTYLRALITRHCVPDGVPVALLDFDDATTRTNLGKDVALVLRDAARQLDRQVVGGLTSLVAGDAPVSPTAFGGALAGLAGIALVICDTTERLLTAHRSAVAHLWDKLDEARKAANGKLRVMFAGRHDLAGIQANGLPEAPGIAERVRDYWRVVPLTGFSPEEAETYLRDVRRVPAARVTRLVDLACGKAVQDKAREANGLKLSLLADLALTGQLDEAAVDGWEDVELVYLIDRVIDRIDGADGGVLQWIVRWGALAEPLSKDLYDQVLWPLLVEEFTKGLDRRRDRAERSELPDQVARRGVWRDVNPTDRDANWIALRTYVTSSSWVRPADRGAIEAVSFHDEVRVPLRRLLAGNPIVTEFHRRARDHFAQRAEDGDRTAQAQAVFHAIALGGPAAEQDVARWLLEGDPTAGEAAAAAAVVLKAHEDGLTVADAWIARAHAELAARAVHDRDLTGILEHLRAMEGRVEWTSSAVSRVRTILESWSESPTTRSWATDMLDAFKTDHLGKFVERAAASPELTSFRDELDALRPSAQHLPAGFLDWLAGAADPDGARSALLSAAASLDVYVAAAANRTLGAHLRRSWDPASLDAYAAALKARPLLEHQLDLAEAQMAFERFGAAQQTLRDGKARNQLIRANTDETDPRLVRHVLAYAHAWLDTGRSAADEAYVPQHVPWNAYLPLMVRRWIQRGKLSAAWTVANEFAPHGGHGQGLARGAALVIDDAVKMLDGFPEDLVNVLLDAELDLLLPGVELRIPSIALTAPAEAEVVRARVAARRGEAVAPSTAGEGPTARIRCALAAVIGGAGSVQTLADALAASDLPERRLVLLDGIADAPEPDLGPLVPLVEACIGDAALDPGVRATLALVLGWGGRRDVAAQLVREALGDELPIGAVRPWIRVHRRLHLQPADLPIPKFNDKGLPPQGGATSTGCPLPGVIWLEVAEALHQHAGDELFERARTLLADMAWRDRLDRREVHAQPPARGPGHATALVRRAKSGWRADIASGASTFAVDVDGEPLPPLDDRALAYRLATAPDAVVDALSRVPERLPPDDPPDTVTLTAADGAWLPWELARWPAFVYRVAAASPPTSPPSTSLRRVLWVNAGTGAPESEPVPRAYRERGFDVQVLPELHPSALADVYSQFEPGIVHLAGTFTTVRARAVLVAKEPIHGDTVGRLLVDTARPATLIVDPITASLSGPERWNQLVLRNAWCAEAAATLARVVGVGCVPDPQRPAHDQALLDGLTHEVTARAAVERSRVAGSDLAFRAVALWIADPGQPLATGSSP